MEWNYFLPILMNSLISQSRVLVVTTNQSFNWFEANNACVNKGGRLAYPNELHPSTCANRSIKVWLGKYKQERLTPWLAKQGCYESGNKEVHSKASILECYRLCNSTLFGFKEPNWCSCTEETTMNHKPYAACRPTYTNFFWFYNSTNVNLSDDRNMMDCLTAQCTENGTIFRPVDCKSPKNTVCQNPNSVSKTDEKKTQANSENFCNDNADYLISKQFCVNHKKTPEFWTGMQRYRYTTENFAGYKRQEVNSTDIFHCVDVKCPIKSGIAPFEYFENCKGQLDGFACKLDDMTEKVTTVRPNPNNTLETTIISSSNSLQFESTGVSLELLSSHSNEPAVKESIYTLSKTALTKTIDVSTTVYNSVIKNKNVTTFSEMNGIHSSNTWNVTSGRANVNIENSIHGSLFATAFSSSESSSLNLGQLLLNSSPRSTTGTSVQINTIHPSLPTSVNLEVFSESATEHVFSESISTNSIAVKSISGIILPATIISSSESSLVGFGSMSMNMINVQPESTVEIGLWSENSISTNGQSSITSFIVPTSVTSDLMYANTSKLGYSASINTSPKSTINSNTDISSRVFTSDRTERNEIKNNNRTSTRNNPSSDQLSTGLIVGISVSILCLVVLIVGVFGICRLRKNQHAFNKKSLDLSTPNNPMNTTKCHDSIKESNLIEKNLTYPVVFANDDDKPFRLTDNTLNSNTSKPNDPYAVVMKKPVTNKANTTSNSKTTDSNKAQDEYAVVVKIPEKDLSKDEQTSLDIPDSTYDSTNQLRSISDNESGNIYDTSIGHRDDSDPTYNTTKHIQAREEKYESDYDHV